MNCRRDVCWLVVVSSLWSGGRCGADEPGLRGRTLSECVKMLEADPRPERRQAALIALEVLGAKSPPAVRAVGKAARADASADVRRQAAQLLGGLGAEAREAIDDLAAALKFDAD